MSCMGSVRSEVIALEQEARCGMAEHTHVAGCYSGPVLLCGQKAHIHGENCYLVLLRENDVNWLVQFLDGSTGRNLEEMIRLALQALREWTGRADLEELTPADIALLNAYMRANGTEYPLLFNEHLEWGALLTAEGEDPQTRPIAVLGFTPAVPDTRKGYANFYVYLDNTWQCVGSLATFEPAYQRAVRIADVVNLCNNALGLETKLVASDFTNGHSSAMSANSTEWLQGWYGDNNRNMVMNYHGDATLYVRITGNWRNDVANPTLKFNSVNFDYNYGSAGTYASKVVRSNTPVTAPADPTRDGYAFTGWYTDPACTQPYNFSANVSSRTTVYAGWKATSLIVTWKWPDGSTTSESKMPQGGQATFDVPDLDSRYIWVREGMTEPVSGTVTVSRSTTYEAVPQNVTVTYLDESGDRIRSYSVTYGSSVQLLAPDEGYVWVGSDGQIYTGAATVSSLRQDLTLKAASSVVATYVYVNGTTTRSTPVTPGTTITLPRVTTDGNVWVDENGNKYNAGAQVQLMENMTFTECRPITITYTVNFPGSISGQTLYPSGGLATNPGLLGVSAVGVPRLTVNLGSSYTLSNVTMLDAPHVVENLNYREVFYRLSNNVDRTFRSVYFLGWEVRAGNQTLLLEPGTAMDWKVLSDIAAANGGTVSLRGRWEDTPGTSVMFFVHYSAKAADLDGNYISGKIEDYTPEVFNGHLFGLPENKKASGHDANPSNTTLYGISGESNQTSLAADTKIRQLYGTGVEYDGSYTVNGQTVIQNGAAATLYMLDFPTDEEVLSKIKLWASNNIITETLRYDEGNGQIRDVPYTVVNGRRDYYDLDADHYTIRWYVFKEHGDGWHVDGRLIRKVGTIKITKQFGGNEDLIRQVKELTEAGGEPFIRAVCEGYYTTQNGQESFIPAASPAPTRSFYFRESREPGDGGYTYDPETDTYYWVIRDVGARERWRITEYPAQPENSLDIAEWIWVNSFSGTADSGMAQETKVTGVTQPADTVNLDWLKVDFANIYHMENSILIRKVDGNTMDGLPGAEFNLYRVVDGVEQQMFFDYDSEKKVYVWNQQNSGIADLPVNEQGFLEYMVSGFSYEAGNIIVREKTAPPGYAKASDITVGYLDPTAEKPVIGILNSESNDAASYQNGVLTVKNYSDGEAAVHAQKNWDCDPSYYEGTAVRFELYANGNIASQTIPGFDTYYGSHYVYLDARGAYVNTDSRGNPIYISRTPWSYRWTGLPTVVSGQAVTYTVVETQVGSEVPDKNGNFPNWIVDEQKNQVSTDDEGNQQVQIIIRNTPNRAMIRLTKYDGESWDTLSGVSFTLTEVNSANTAYTLTTDENGVITFDNLKYETWYSLVEQDAPPGYTGFEDRVYLRLSNTGVVTVTTDLRDPAKAHTHVYYPNQANNIFVINDPVEALPETGGAGIHRYQQSGLALMLLAMALLLYKKPYRRRDRSS